MKSGVHFLTRHHGMGSGANDTDFSLLLHKMQMKDVLESVSLSSPFFDSSILIHCFGRDFDSWIQKVLAHVPRSLRGNAFYMLFACSAATRQI